MKDTKKITKRKIKELALKILNLLEELENYIDLKEYGIELQDELYLLASYGENK